MRRLTFILPFVALALPAAASAATGAELWERYCSNCHGASGNGDTPMGKHLAVRDFTSAEIQDSLSDDTIRQTIRDGKRSESGQLRMLAFGKRLSAEEIDLLVAHLRSLKAD